MTATEDLIARLAAEPVPQRFLPRRIAVLAVASVVLPVAAFLLVAGVRDGLLQAWTNPVVPMKTLLPMLTCILSDTLEFRSPTTTPHDRAVAEKLAADLGVDIPRFAAELFAAKSDVQLVKVGFKQFRCFFNPYACNIID